VSPNISDNHQPSYLAVFLFMMRKQRLVTCEVVTRLKNAGAIILDKMNMYELGMGTTLLVSYFGPVHNRWDHNYVAGGSSGGSAAAVAAGLCFTTVDTDLL
jgi:aspartyl-tRNA(Asn)/glutamyl-tRNA(Gln) amidotransferase subunit A